MNLFQALMMGIVQGLSEFLPISSSAHLVITSNLYKVLKNVPVQSETSQEIFLDIMLHLGTLIAVLVFYRKDIAEIIKSLVNAVKRKDFTEYNAKMGIYIIIGTVITVVVAFPMEKVAEKLVYSPVIVGGMLVFTGFYLCISEAYSKKISEKSNKIDLKTSIFVAISQGLAALPGFSRSGLTISTALLCKKDRISAAKYSFLLSIPIILGASMVYPFLKIDISEFQGYNWGAIIISSIVSGIVGYLCIKYFIKFVGKYSLSFFGYYCIIIGVLTAVFFTLY